MKTKTNKDSLEKKSISIQDQIIVIKDPGFEFWKNWPCGFLYIKKQMSDVIGTYYQYGFLEDKFGNSSYRPSLKAEGITLNLNFVEAFFKGS